MVKPLFDIVSMTEEDREYLERYYRSRRAKGLLILVAVVIGGIVSLITHDGGTGFVVITVAMIVFLLSALAVQMFRMLRIRLDIRSGKVLLVEGKADRKLKQSAGYGGNTPRYRYYIFVYGEKYEVSSRMFDDVAEGDVVKLRRTVHTRVVVGIEKSGDV